MGLNWLRYGIALILWISCQVSMAASISLATLTRIEGDVKILSKPSAKAIGDGPHVKFEEMIYQVRQAVLGETLQLNNVLQTGGDGKARLVYRNGDQISVAPNSSYRVRWGDEAGKTTMDVMFGKVRMMIKKDGERSGMEVRARSAVMGVRGTDFFVKTWSEKGGTEVSVLRGEVEVKSTAPGSKPASVPAGFSAALPVTDSPKANGKQGDSKISEAPSPQQPPVEIAVRPTTKQELVKIQTETVVKKAESAPIANTGDTKIKKDLEDLEKQAVEATLEDIKKADPALHEQIVKQGVNPDNADALSSATVKKAFDKAPEAPKVIKPDDKELDDIDSKSYEKYFKVDD